MVTADFSSACIRTGKIITPFFIVTLTSVQAHAGGFGLVSNAGSGNSHSYSNNPVNTDDASGVYHNPATMAHMPQQLSGGLLVLNVDTTVTDRGSTVPAQLGLGSTGGDPVGEPGTTTPVPNLFYNAPINDQLSYGVAVNVPFGQTTDYGDQWSGRYQADYTEITGINVNPAISYRVNDRLSVGAGVNVQMFSAELSSALDSSAACLSAVSGSAAAQGADAATAQATAVSTCANAGLATPGNRDTDSSVTLEGDSLELGFNVGAYYEISDKTQVGAAFRSGISHELEGESSYDLNPALRAVVGDSALTGEDIVAPIDTPSSLDIGIKHQLNERVRLNGTLGWTEWSSVPELRVDRADGSTLVNNPLDWEDTMRVAAGVEYAYRPDTTLKFGIGHDPTPVPNVYRRTPRAPSTDLTWVSAGVNQRINANMDLDVGASYLTLDDTSLSYTDSQGYTTRADVDGSVAILSMQLNYRFD